jgi:hypothetical protein
LRHRLGVIGGELSADAFDAARPIVVEAQNALSSLKSRWELQHGHGRGDAGAGAPLLPARGLPVF